MRGAAAGLAVGLGGGVRRRKLGAGGGLPRTRCHSRKAAAALLSNDLPCGEQREGQAGRQERSSLPGHGVAVGWRRDLKLMHARQVQFVPRSRWAPCMVLVALPPRRQPPAACRQPSHTACVAQRSGRLDRHPAASHAAPDTIPIRRAPHVRWRAASRGDGRGRGSCPSVPPASVSSSVSRSAPLKKWNLCGSQMTDFNAGVLTRLAGDHRALQLTARRRGAPRHRTWLLARVRF